MPLHNDEIITYLANVIAIARADGELSTRESGAIENIQRKINAKKSDLKKAFVLAESTDFKMLPVGRFIDKIQNLEDLIYTASIDGQVNQTENIPILEFAKKIDLSEEQLNTVFEDVRTILSAEISTISCPKCGQQIPSTVKFCPQCGISIVEAEEQKSVKIAYRIPTSGIAIEFAESTSSGFSRAVQIAKTALMNEICIKDNKKWYLAAWPSSEILKISELVEYLKGIRNRKVYVDGAETNWDEVFGFSWCVTQRNSAYRPIEYCFGIDEKRFNIWGCKQARMDWTEWADWFSYGSFRKTGPLKNQVIFVFDKERINHELKTNLYKFRFCPYLNFKLIQAVLDAFPKEVIATDKGPWMFKRGYEETPGSIHVKVDLVENGYTSRDEFFSNGVIPKSLAISLEILRNAISSCGERSAELNSILDYKG